MISVHVLGISGALPNKDYENISLALNSPGYSALIDCAGNPLQKIQRIGINPQDLDAVVITHRHPDHVYGLPFLLQGLGLLGRNKKFTIYTTFSNISFINSIIDLFDLRSFTDGFLRIQGFPFVANHELISNKELSIFTTPVEHGVPTVAVKFINKATTKCLTYSSDTGPSNQLIDFAQYSEVLIHECSSPGSIESQGHSNGKQAGRIARLAQVRKLVLVHLPVYDNDIESSKKDAMTEYSGEVEIPDMYSSYVF